MSGFSLTLASGNRDRDELITELWEAGTTGVTEEDTWIRAFFDEDADSDALVERFRAFGPALEQQENYDWIAHSHSLWQPFSAGKRFWLSPEWDSSPTPEGRLRLPIRPGLASGSGSHPATRLCLEALEQTVRAGDWVLDVGTGSGILAEAARLLGASFVAGCDVDHDAAWIARRNWPGLPVFTGTTDTVRPNIFSIVVANLDASTLATAADGLFDTAAETVIVSGFQDFEASGLHWSRPPRQTMELDGWMCAIC